MVFIQPFIFIIKHTPVSVYKNAPVTTIEERNRKTYYKSVYCFCVDFKDGGIATIIYGFI